MAALIGREGLVSSTLEVLGQGGVAVSLVGPPGVGKSRVLLAIAERWCQRSVQPVLWVSLAAAEDAVELPAAMVEALGLRGVPAEPAALEARIVSVLRERSVALLCFDGVERLRAEVAAFVMHALAECPSLSIATSSLVPLQIGDERRIDVPRLEREDSRELFRARARDWAGVEVDEGELPRLDTILDALDDLPLAIELAASRLDVLTPSDLVCRLASLPELLRDDREDLPQRHRSIAAAIRWAFDLLEPLEREALVQCTVFRASFDLESAAAVVSLPAKHGERLPSMLDVLAGLRRKGLIAVAGTGAPRRFVLLESVRQTVEQISTTDVVEDDVAAIPRREAASRRLADHLSQTLPWEEERVAGPRRAQHEADLALASFDLRAAFERHERVSPGPALRCGLAYDLFLEHHAPMDERVAWLDRLVAAADAHGEPELLLRTRLRRAEALGAWGKSADAERDAAAAHEVGKGIRQADKRSRLMARCAIVTAWARRALGHQIGADEAVDRAAALAAASQDARTMALAVKARGLGALSAGNEVLARRCLEEAIAALAVAGDEVALAGAYESLGLVVTDPREALANRQRAAELFAALGDDRRASRAEANVAVIETLLGRLAAAEARFERCLPVARRAGYRFGVAVIELNLAVLAHRRALGVAAAGVDIGPQMASVVERLRVADHLVAELDNPALTALARAHLAAAEAARGDLQGARARMADARAESHRGRSSSATAVELLEGFIDLALARCAGTEDSRAELEARAAARLGGHLEDELRADARAAAQMLAMALANAGTPVVGLRSLLILGPRLAWLGRRGRSPIDLSRQPVLRRLLEVLVDHLCGGDPAAVPVEILVRRVWPDETFADMASAKNRLWVLLSKLRRLGLDDLLQQGPDGYRLDPETEVVPVPDGA